MVRGERDDSKREDPYHWGAPMVAVAACPTPIQQFLNNAGQFNVGGSILTQVGGVNAPTYQDIGGSIPLPNPIPLNSRGEVSDISGHSQQLFLPINTVYVFTIFDANGNQIDQASYVNATQVSAATIGAAIYPVLPSEGISVVNITSPYGNPIRYGGTGGPAGSVPSVDDSVAWAAAVATGYVNLPPGWAFKVLSGASYTGQITVTGAGRRSEIYSDVTILTVSAGTGSIVDNFWIGNITPPWIVTRNPSSWATTIPYTSLVQSNSQLGYQPTVNDPEYSSWVTAIPAVGTQNIGPVILCTGSASDITVSRIFGRFGLVIIRDAINSTIRDCSIRGGKGQWGTLQFDNWTNGTQRGSGNRIINNRVQYGSFSGCYFAANDDFTCCGNQSFRNGESGVKTLQAQGILFTTTLAIGATAGTISVPGSLTNGAWTFVFQSGDTDAVTVTGGTACTWSAGLTTASYCASAYQTTLNPQCFRGQIEDNHCYQNYYDQLDCNSTSNTTVDAARTYHQINNNYAYNGGGDGINADGQYNSYVGNHIYGNYQFGFWGTCSFSLIQGNHCIGNNLGNSGSVAELLGGVQGNSILGNRIVQTASPGFPIFASQIATSVPHVASGNVTIGSTNDWGNGGAIYPVLNDNIDASTGYFTPQSFCFILQNAAGTLQHAFYSDLTEATAALLTRIAGNNSGSFTTTPTGTDASTAFAAGAKVSTTTTNAVVFNTTNPQTVTNEQFHAVVVQNSTTTALTVAPVLQSFSVNGVTQTRLLFNFYNATTGAAFAINTTNVGSGTKVAVWFWGKLA